jgi:hypothetical protein
MVRFFLEGKISLYEQWTFATESNPARAGSAVALQEKI